MRALLDQPVARRVLSATAVGSLADWTTFAALVAVVAAFTEGSVFAVAIVACARILPSCVLGPVLAPYAGVLGIRPTLVAVEAVRAATILAVGFAGSLPAVAAGLVALELTAALGSATRETAISGGVRSGDFRVLNASTGALSYGMVPIGGLVAAGLLRVDPVAPFALAAICYAVNAALYARTPELDGSFSRPREQVSALAGLRAVRAPGALRETVMVAACGAVAIAMLFSLGSVVANLLFGGAEDTGLLLAMLGAGALLGGLAAQRGLQASTGMAIALGGTALLGLGGLAGMGGVIAVGAGAGVAYVVTQERLQHVGRAPEEFAAAFAVLKVAVALAMVGGPLVHGLAGMPGVLVAMAAATLSALVILVRRLEAPAGLPLALRATAFLAVGRAVLPRLCRLEVEGRLPDRPAVVVSNHPNGLDGPVAMLLDRRIRPVAKPQRNLLARAGFALSGTLVTGGGAVDMAAGHLRRGGMVWLAPEGGISGPVLRRPRTGAARMAMAAGVPIVPLAIRYADQVPPRLWAWRPWRRPSVRLVVGAPITVALGADPDQVGDRYMAALAGLLGCTYEGQPLRRAA